MPTYEFICPKCKKEYEFTCSISKYEEWQSDASQVVCDDCPDTEIVRHYRTPPNFKIPAQSSYNGVTKISGSSGNKEELNEPINIIDKQPDGSCKVTRIGRKQDIENE